MNSFLENRYKDRKPKDTVAYLKSILKKLNIEVEEHWNSANEISTYSLRLLIKDTNIGTNGKGATKDLALASAYGEFFERLQNYKLFNIFNYYGQNLHPLISKDEKFLSSKEIASQKSPVLDLCFKLNKKSSLSIKKKSEWFDQHCYNKYTALNKGTKYLCLPFSNISNNEVVYLPRYLTDITYWSNGMAAGNTKEEALVEAISEIIERYVHRLVIHERLSLPDIPESYIKKFPKLHSTWKKLKNVAGVNVYLKDASLGGVWPAAALIIVNSKTGTLGVNFGCHPCCEIAIERVFTESTQGRQIEAFSKTARFESLDAKISKDTINNAFADGSGVYPLEILKSSGKFAFNKLESNYSNNADILNSLIRKIEKLNYQVLVRDATCLGFPAFHVIIPGMSEICNNNEEDLLNLIKRDYAKNQFLEISKINKHTAKLFLGLFNFYSGQYFMNSFFSYLPPCKNLKVSMGGSIYGVKYFGVMLYVMLEDFKNAYSEFLKIYNVVQQLKNVPEEAQLQVSTIKVYLEFRSNGLTHKVAAQYIGKIFNRKAFSYVNSLFCDTSKILRLEYPDYRKMLGRSKFFYPYRQAKFILDTMSEYNSK